MLNIYNIAKFYTRRVYLSLYTHKSLKKIQEERKERVSIITVLNACENI